MRRNAGSAVVLGLSPTGLYAVRELGKAGVRVLGVDRDGGCGAYSRYLREAGAWRAGDDDAELERRLLAYAQAQDSPPLLLPTSDVFIEFVMQRAAALGQGFGLFPCYLGIAADLLDKARFHALCAHHGVAQPGRWEVADRRDLDRHIDAIPYPCIVKPVLIHRAKRFLRGKKILLAEDRATLIRHMDAIPPDTGSWLVQEIIPGPESEISVFAGYFDQDGEPRQAFTARKLRQYPAGFGSASLVLGRRCDETRDRSIALLRAIGFKGICGTEFKRDPRDGMLKIIEINPRPTLWFQLCHASGKRVVEAALRDMTNGPPLPDALQTNGVLWRYGLKDLASRAFYLAAGKRFVFDPPDTAAARDAVARCWPIHDASDPLPAVLEPVGYLRKFLARMR